jgi:hypothetical protein
MSNVSARRRLVLAAVIGALVDHRALTPGNHGSQRQSPVANGLTASLGSRKPDYVRTEPIDLVLTLGNVSGQVIPVISHYETSAGRHLDPVELHIVRTEDQRRWSFSLMGPRKGVAKIGCLLPPGGTLHHELDLRQWLRLKRMDIGVGTFEIVAVYTINANEPPLNQWTVCDQALLTGGAESPPARDLSRQPWRGVVTSNGVVVRIRPN